jgi:Ran-binding protein 3
MKVIANDTELIVMRAEGVLRLILNVSLYVGMSCLEDGKHVRLTVFEDGERRFVTLRVSTQRASTSEQL